MSFDTSHEPSATTMLNARHRTQRHRSRRGSAIALNRRRVARAFYRDTLHGRQVWDTESDGRADRLSFIVEGTRIDVDTSVAGEREPVVLAVRDREALAARCWDAGFSVCVRQDATGREMLAVVDPFGRRIELVP